MRKTKPKARGAAHDEPTAAQRRAKPANAQALVYEEEIRAQQEHAAQTMTELEQTRDRYVQLYDGAPMGYLSLDCNGVIEELSLAAAKLLDRERPHIVGRPLLVYVTSGDRQVFLDHMVRCRNHAGQHCSDLHLVRRNGAPVLVQLCTVSAPRARLGGKQYLTAVMDLTDRQRLEEERWRAQEECRQTILKEQAAQASARAKDRFIAMLSHELRTPLTPILAAVSVLTTQEWLPEDARHTIEMIRRNVKMEARLIDDLLDVTRIARNKLKLKFEAVDLHRVVHDIAQMLSDELCGRNLLLHLDLKADYPTVWGDAGRLQQVLWNLLSNAIKFTPDGGRIFIRTANCSVPDGIRIPDEHAHRHSANVGVAIEVADTGVGMDGELMPQLFRPFEQAASGESRGGLGLGLSICRGLVDAHGGTIEARSAGPGKGSTFTVTLAGIKAPRRPAAAKPADQHAPAQREPVRHNGEKLHILLVEDHPDTARIMSRLLSSEGYRVSVANSVESALRQAEELPQLLISDIGLPDGSGLDLMRQLQQRRPLHGIALSGFGTDQDISRSKEAGFDEHFTKPVDFTQLADAIARLESLCVPAVAQASRL